MKGDCLEIYALDQDIRAVIRNVTPQKAVPRFCMKCRNGDKWAVVSCGEPGCGLWPYRTIGLSRTGYHADDSRSHKMVLLGCLQRGPDLELFSLLPPIPIP